MRLTLRTLAVGLALAALPALAAADLAVGRLVAPFELAVKADYGYYIVHDPAASERPAIQAFIGWLLEEAGRPPETATSLP